MQNKTIYIATLSGGKDSVTMCDLLLKNGYPIDYIVFNDTLDEFTEMYEYLNKIEKYFKLRYGKSITRLKPNWDYDKQYIFGTLSRGKRKGQIRGLPTASDGFCTWKRESKIVPFKKWIKANNINNHKIYIGITLNEMHRADRNKNFLYPLIDDFQMTENECKQYLINQEMENPLYRHFNRTGCKKCQYQSDRDFFQIWKYYPEVWEEFKSYEQKTKKLNNIVSSTWFTDYRSCLDMQKQFEKSNRQGSLFDFSDEPLKNCFCKI